MRIRFISLTQLLVVASIATSFIPAAAQVTISPGVSSTVLVNGHNPILTVTGPLDDSIATVTCGGGVCTIAFSATIDSFALNATTSGDWPCGSSSPGQSLF